MTTIDIFGLLLKILEKNSIEDLAKKINITDNTIKRWLLLERVPSDYILDFYNILNIDIDYENFSFKEKNQFFTPRNTSKYCIELLCKQLEELGVNESKYTYIEPSAGAGSFFNLLPVKRRIGMDIEPRHKDIIKNNFLKWEPTSSNNIVIGNPPFGLRGQTALRFINHSYKFADFVAFILPQLFESDGKGTPMNRVDGYNLILSEKIDNSFEYPDNTEVKVNVVFQIWAKNFTNNFFTKEKVVSKNIKVYSLSDGGSSSTTRNIKMVDKCDIYIPSTCFGLEKMKVYKTFEELPNRKGYGIVFLKEKEKILSIFKNTDWTKKSFKSTNSAFNLRTSIIERVIKDGLY